METFKEQILEENIALSLKCIASGNPLPQVRWLLDGQPLPDNSRFRFGDFVTKDGLLVSYVNITSVISQGGFTHYHLINKVCLPVIIVPLWQYRWWLLPMYGKQWCCINTAHEKDQHLRTTVCETNEKLISCSWRVNGTQLSSHWLSYWEYTMGKRLDLLLFTDH